MCRCWYTEDVDSEDELSVDGRRGIRIEVGNELSTDVKVTLTKTFEISRAGAAALLSGCCNCSFGAAGAGLELDVGRRRWRWWWEWWTWWAWRRLRGWAMVVEMVVARRASAGKAVELEKSIAGDSAG